MYLYQFQDDEYNSLKQNLDSDLPQLVEQRNTYSHLENWTGELLGMLLPQALLNLIIAQESSLCEIFVLCEIPHKAKVSYTEFCGAVWGAEGPQENREKLAKFMFIGAFFFFF